MNNTTIINEVLNFAGSPPPSWGGTVLYVMFFIGIPLVSVAVGLAVLWNIASYTRAKKYLEQFANSFRYVLLGLITCVVLAIPMAVLYWGYVQAKAGNTVPFKYGVYIILGYIVLVIIGLLVEKYIINRVADFEKELNKDKKEKEEVKDKTKTKQTGGKK